MSTQIQEQTTQQYEDLIQRAQKVSFPTIGHYLEQGFVDPDLRRICGTEKVVGRAVTVRTTAQDSTYLHHAAGLCEPGDVFVIDTGGDRIHAPVGEVLAEALKAKGAVAVIVDGVVTDVDEIEATGLAAYARGTSVLTTKLLGGDGGGHNIPVVCGGVVVNPGDIVMADRNGVLILAPEKLAEIVDIALQDDAEEPELVEQIRAGARLGELTGASEMVAKLQNP